MVHVEYYEPLGITPLAEETIRAAFLNSLIESNRSPEFFVDWAKVRRNVESQRNLLQYLSSIRGSQDPQKELATVLVQTPAVARVIPLLAAWRAASWPVLRKSPDGALRSDSVDFSGSGHYSGEQLQLIVDFCQDSGVLKILSESANLEGYLLGVEVGMDTNARKNRSGKFMESHVEPHIHRACSSSPSWTLYSQRKFADIHFSGLDVPRGLLNRKFDYAIIGPPSPISIEVNYYDKEGSKPQEIVDSYIQRAGELSDSGWSFVWITDGPCWKGDTPQIRKAFSELDSVLNLDFCRRGVLDRILGAVEPNPPREPAISPGTPTQPPARQGLERWMR